MISIICLIVLLVVVIVLAVNTDCKKEHEPYVMRAIDRRWDDDGDIETHAPHNFIFGKNDSTYKFLFPPRYLLNVNARENRHDFRV